MKPISFKGHVFNVLDANGNVVYQGPINRCSIWVNQNPMRSGSAERSRRRKGSGAGRRRGGDQHANP